MQEKTEQRVVDRALAEELATRYIPAEAILEALEDYPEKEARGLLKWAHVTDSPEKALAAWGKKRGAPVERERRREVATRSGRSLALEGALRTTHRKLLAAEYLLSRRQKALEGSSYEEEIQERIETLARGYVGDADRISLETLRLKIGCAAEYPPDALEKKLELNSEAERNLEQRVSEDAELTRDDELKLETYSLATEALVEELRQHVSYLEERLEDALERKRDPSGYIRTEVKELPYIPREYDR